MCDKGFAKKVIPFQKEQIKFYTWVETAGPSGLFTLSVLFFMYLTPGAV
jgi:hypothetical protein